MSEQEQVKSKNLTNVVALVILVGLAVYYVSSNAERALAIALSLAGLGVVIFVHEMGHFIAGKLSDIRVEAFAIGFGPIFIGVKKCAAGLRVRVLPTLFLKASDESSEGLLCFTLPGKFKPGETEYQLRLIPLGGFVKLMGQEDTGADKPSDDPRSFVNKPIWKRVFVGASGVVLNIVLAIALFVVVYTVGIKFPPAVVGAVREGYPAAQAGLIAGDEIIAINGKSGRLNFSDVGMAAALCGKGKSVQMTVKRRDGSVVDLVVPVKELPGAGFSGFGISSATSLEIAMLGDSSFFELTGISAGDRLIGVNDKPIEHFWQYSEIIEGVFAPEVKLSFARIGSAEPIVYDMPMQYQAAYRYVDDSNDFIAANVYGLAPRLKITGVVADVNDLLRSGDVIVEVAGTPSPNYKQLRELTESHVGRDMPMVVFREGQAVSVIVMPKLSEDGRGRIGISVGLDLSHPAIAFSLDANSALLPAGATIKSIDGADVANFFDIASVLESRRAKTVKVVYLYGAEIATVSFSISPQSQIQMKGLTAYNIPFKPLTRLYKASGPIDAAKMGVDKTVGFIMQSYMTIKGLIVGRISPKGLMGPVGIISASSTIIAEREFLQYINFMAIISACLAVMNFLPLPILDGGLVLLLIIEKLKGSPVNIKVQEIITYIGIALIGTLFVVITYNDIVRLIKNAFGG